MGKTQHKDGVRFFLLELLECATRTRPKEEVKSRFIWYQGIDATSMSTHTTILLLLRRVVNHILCVMLKHVTRRALLKDLALPKHHTVVGMTHCL